MKNNVRADEFRNEGNSFFSQIKFYEALISYNKSLCHAVPKSTQLALAYANRSAVYLELKQFDKCLENIQQARDNKYPNEAKLKERETKCKEEQEQLKAQKPDGKNDPWTYFKLSYPANKKIPFIVDCLQLNTNEKYGRHIVSNRDLNPGDIIAIEPPTFHSLDVASEAWYSKCTFCLKSNMLNLIPCNFEDDSRNCTSAMYCNEDCMTKARDQFHGVLCLGFETLLTGCDAESTNIASIAICKRLLESLYIAQSPQALQSLMSSNKQSTIFEFDLSNQLDDPAADLKYLSIFNNLEVDSAKDSESIFRHISSLFVQLTPKFSKTRSQSPELVVDYSTRLAMISHRNTIGLLCRSKWVGTAILPFGSLYNHACDNNIYLALIDNKFVHFVMKPIKRGEQLFINYGFHYDAHDRLERQKYLLKNYGFTCSCAACLNDWSVMSLARFDPKFVKPAKNLPDTIQGSMTELRRHCKYIKRNFKNYPSYELHQSVSRCKFLLSSIGDNSSWPF